MWNKIQVGSDGFRWQQPLVKVSLNMLLYRNYQIVTLLDIKGFASSDTRTFNYFFQSDWSVMFNDLELELESKKATHFCVM